MYLLHVSTERNDTKRVVGENNVAGKFLEYEEDSSDQKSGTAEQVVGHRLDLTKNQG